MTCDFLLRCHAHVTDTCKVPIRQFGGYFPMRTASILALLTAIAFSSGALAETRQVKRDARSGDVVRVAVHAIYGSNCRGQRKPVIKIRQRPVSGTVSVRGSMEEVRRGDCAGREVPGVGVFYKANPGFKGRDRFVYDRADDKGKVQWTVDAVITVR